MAFQPDGSFKRVIVGGWQADRDAGTKITAVRHDEEDDGFATGLGTCITRTGVSTVLADIPWNNKRITDYASITPSDAPDTVVNKGYVDNFKDFTTGLEITGAGPINGFITFKAPTGVNGIGWTTADMSWVGKIADPDKTSKRLVVNDAVDGTGNSVCIIDENGHINNSGVLSHNTSREGPNWRTIAKGISTLMTYSGGAFSFYSNDVATTVDYQIAPVRQFFQAQNNGGSPVLDLTKSASGKSSSIRSYVGTELRWNMILGYIDAESSTRTGSTFYLQSYDNAGANVVNEIAINRSTHLMTTAGGITAGGTVTSAQNFDSVSSVCVISATSPGSVRIRPDGPTSTGGAETIFDTNGNVWLSDGLAAATGGLRAGLGMLGKAGSNGAYTSTYHNFWYSAGLIHAYVDNAHMGTINVTPPSDYRLKRDIQPLGSTWDAVKHLNPISYRQRGGVFDLFDDDPAERWGFAAHELQEALVESAATGVKDEPDRIQMPNPWPVIAALTKALQEAMLRIEALEAGS